METGVEGLIDPGKYEHSRYSPCALQMRIPKLRQGVILLPFLAISRRPSALAAGDYGSD